MAKKSFGKRFVAILSTLALLLSMVAMVGSFAVSAEGYTPKRTITFTTSDGIQQSCMMLENACDVAGGKEVTVKGYYKVDSITGSKFELLSGSDVATEPTNDWVYFEIPYAVPEAPQWKSFGFWEASGSFALADITFEDADGTVLYDLATDDKLIAGTYEFDVNNKFTKQGIWYVMGAYGTVAEGATCTVEIDDVYAPPSYTPKRTITFTTSDGIQQSCMMLENACDVAGGKEVTVKGYYKVDSITGSKFELLSGSDVATEPTNDWVYFEIPYTVPEAPQWKSFGFWEASGSFALADITFEDADGTVLYDLATDDKLIAGTYEFDVNNKFTKQGIWYVMGAYGTVAEGATCTVEIDDVYAPPSYTPKRTITFTTSDGIQQSCMMLENACDVAGGKEVTVKGYYKVDSITGSKFELLSGSDVATEPTNDWVSFEIPYAVPEAPQWKSFGFWEASGSFALADITFEDADGTVLYDLATDDKLIAGTYEFDVNNKFTKQGIWYVMGAYGTVAEGATCTVKIDEAQAAEDDGPVIVPTPGVIPMPEIPDMLAADESGYAPNRAFGVINTKDALATATFAAWAEDYFVTASKYYVFAHVKVSGFEGFEGATDAACQIEMLAGENPAQIIGSWNANTEGWVALADENGDPISFEKLTMADSFILNFSVKNAKANFIIGDLIIADAAGNIVYSLANDKKLNLESDMRYTTSVEWAATPHVSNPDGPALFPIQTKGNTEYIPNVAISVAPDNYQPGLTSEAFLAIVNQPGVFEAGKTYTIEGKINVYLKEGFYKNANPIGSYKEDSLVSTSTGLSLGTTSGWVSLVHPNGTPLTFTCGEGMTYVKFNMYQNHGVLSLADIVIKDSEGNVVYDMAKDEILLGQAGEFECEGFVDKGAIWRIVLNNYAVGEIYVNETPVEHTAEDYTVPTFVETVTVPSEDEVPPTSGMAILLIAALGAMSATGAAALTLKKKEN